MKKTTQKNKKKKQGSGKSPKPKYGYRLLLLGTLVKTPKAKEVRLRAANFWQARRIAQELYWKILASEAFDDLPSVYLSFNGLDGSDNVARFEMLVIDLDLKKAWPGWQNVAKDNYEDYLTAVTHVIENLLGIKKYKLVQTSPEGNLHVWIPIWGRKVTLDAFQRLQRAIFLALQPFGADPGSLGAKHLFRLDGVARGNYKEQLDPALSEEEREAIDESIKFKVRVIRSKGNPEHPNNYFEGLYRNIVERTPMIPAFVLPSIIHHIRINVTLTAIQDFVSLSALDALRAYTGQYDKPLLLKETWEEGFWHPTDDRRRLSKQAIKLAKAKILEKHRVRVGERSYIALKLVSKKLQDKKFVVLLTEAYKNKDKIIAKLLGKTLDALVTEGNLVYQHPVTKKYYVHIAFYEVNGFYKTFHTHPAARALQARAWAAWQRSKALRRRVPVEAIPVTVLPPLVVPKVKVRWHHKSFQCNLAWLDALPPPSVGARHPTFLRLLVYLKHRGCLNEEALAILERKRVACAFPEAEYQRLLVWVQRVV